MNKVLIWGTGNIASQLLLNGINADIIGFIETNRSVEIFNDKKIYEIDEIPLEYDYIIVANAFVDDVYKLCKIKNIPLCKLIFLKKIRRQEGLLNLDIIQEIIGEINFTDYCKEFNLERESFFKKDMQKYIDLNTRNNFNIQEQYIWPVIQDKYAMAGTIGNYFLQDLWAAKLVIKSGIKSHLDIGSRLDGFIAHLLASNIEVTMIDIREFPSSIEHLHTIVDDATTLRQIPDESVDSMSALCSLEHFGLGRYGDSINPEACFECFKHIPKKLKSGGKLYLSLPVGMERLEFNAHRVFYASTIIECFKDLELEDFSCASQGKIERNVELHKYDNDEHNGEYRYGLFLFKKP